MLFAEGFGPIERRIIQVLAISGAFLLGHLFLGGFLAGAGRIVRKPVPNGAARFLRFGGGIAAAVAVYLILSGSGGFGIGGEGANNSDTGNNPPNRDQTPKEKVDPKLAPVTGSVLIVTVANALRDDEKHYVVDGDPVPKSLDEVMTIAESRRGSGTLTMRILRPRDYLVQAFSKLDARVGQAGYTPELPPPR